MLTIGILKDVSILAFIWFLSLFAWSISIGFLWIAVKIILILLIKLLNSTGHSWKPLRITFFPFCLIILIFLLNNRNIQLIFLKYHILFLIFYNFFILILLVKFRCLHMFRIIKLYFLYHFIECWNKWWFYCLFFFIFAYKLKLLLLSQWILIIINVNLLFSSINWSLFLFVKLCLNALI